MLVPVSFRHRRLTSILRKPRSRTDSPVADAKADARIANAALLLVAASMPDSVVLLLREGSAALLLRAASAVSKVLLLRAVSVDPLPDLRLSLVLRQVSDLALLRLRLVASAALDRREPSDRKSVV